MIPNLLCFLLGSLLAGPLADWARDSLGHLLRWRWRLVLWGRLIETVALGLAIWAVANGAPTIGRVLPYALIRAFMKTGLGATRDAFELDLLSIEEVQHDAQGNVRLDERGEPLLYKVHLLSMTGLLSSMSAIATLCGLLLGGKILAATGGNYVPILAFDVLTNIAFIIVIFTACHPTGADRAVRIAEFFGKDAGASSASKKRAGSLVRQASTQLVLSFREVLSFLRQPAQRPLLFLLVGRWMTEVINEFYDGKMMIKHVLHGTDDMVRHAELIFSLVEIGVLAFVPVLVRGIGSIGKIFLAVMILDGMIMTAAGRLSTLSAITVVTPFVTLLSVDRAMTMVGGTLCLLAQNSASSTAMRGRLTGVYVLVVIVSDLLAQITATALADRFGIPGLLWRVGVVQILLMCLVAAVGGRALWSFGLRSDAESKS